MSAVYYLQCSAGAYTAPTLVAPLGVSNLSLALNSQLPDRLTFEIAAATALTDDLPFAHGSTLTLWADGVALFRGTVQEPARIATGVAERLHYTALGPWYDLAHTVYRQSWQEWSGGALVSGIRSRVILGQAANGSRLTTGQQIADAIAVCAAAYTAAGLPAPLQAGSTSSLATAFPWAEERDLMCAEVIQRMLRYHPDAVAAFDYSTTPPTLNVRPRSAMSAISVPVSAVGNLSDLDIHARRDLVPPGLRIRFEQTHTADGEQYSTLTDQTAGDPDHPNAILSTVELAGSRLETLAETLTTEALPASFTNDDVGKPWWRTKLPALQKDPAAQQVFSDVTFKTPAGLDVPTGEDYYDRILLTGTVQPWMSSVIPVETVISAKLTLTVLGKDAYTEAKVTEQRVSYRCTLLKDVTGNDHEKTFRAVGVSVSAETIPSGFAAAIYAAWSTLHYEGKIALHAEDCPTTAYLGAKLNLTGARAEWATMNTIVQSVLHQLDNGRSTIAFGPPGQVAIADMIALLHAVRSRPLAWGWSLRQTGTIGSEKQPSGGAGPRGDAHHAEGECTRQKWISYDLESIPDAHFVADPAAVKAASQYQVFQRTTVEGVPTTGFDFVRAV
jgi:hypothetical protein